MTLRSACVRGSVTIHRPEPRSKGSDTDASALSPRVDDPPWVSNWSKSTATAELTSSPFLNDRVTPAEALLSSVVTASSPVVSI